MFARLATLLLVGTLASAHAFAQEQRGSIEGVVRDAPAILATWFLGSEMGNAVADVLFELGLVLAGSLTVAVAADLIEGIIVANRLSGPDALRVRGALWASLGYAVDAEVRPVERRVA